MQNRCWLTFLNLHFLVVLYIIRRDVTFVQLWKELETIPRTGPKASVALQFAH